MGVATAIHEVDRADFLDLFADADALSAQDALVRIALDRGARDVQLVVQLLSAVATFTHAECVGLVLELARSAADAVEAVVRMVGQQQFDDRLACSQSAGAMRHDFHSFADRERTTGHESRTAFQLDNAHSARTGRKEVLHITQRGHRDARTLHGLENGLAGVGDDLAAVEFNGNFFAHEISLFHQRPACFSGRMNGYFFTTAANLHTSKHAPQRMHLSSTM